MHRILLITAALGAATLSCGGGNGLPTANAPNPTASTSTAALTTTLPAAATTTFSTPTIAAALPTLAPITAPNAATPTTAVPLPTFSPITTTVAAPLATLPPTTTTVAPPAGLPPGVPYTDWVTITDDSQLISVSVPASWADIDGRMWESSLATGNDELIGPALTATPDIDGFISTWGTPGVFIGASAMIDSTPLDVIDQYDFTDDCTFAGRYDYDDGLYVGAYDEYVGCGSAGGELYQIVAAPQPQTWIASVQIVIATEADREAASQIINTWEVQELAG